MNRRTLISIIMIIIVVVITLILLIRRGVMVGPDDNELVHNGSFEAHPERFVPTDSEPISNGSNCKMLCGGSSTLDGVIVAVIVNFSAPATAANAPIHIDSR